MDINDRTIRMKILQLLKNNFDNTPHSNVTKETLEKELKLDQNVLIRNIKYLEEKGVIDVTKFLGGDFFTKINSYGIDFVEQESEKKRDIYPKKVKQNYQDPTLDLIFDETRKEVDTWLEKNNKEILNRLDYVYRDINNPSDNFNFSRVAFDCREILKDFTDYLINNNSIICKEGRPTREQTKNKIKLFLQNKIKSKTLEQLISNRFEYITNYFDSLYDFIQKNTHPEGFKVQSEDARSCIIYTYLFLRDLIKIIKINDEKKEKDENFKKYIEETRKRQNTMRSKVFDYAKRNKGKITFDEALSLFIDDPNSEEADYYVDDLCDILDNDDNNFVNKIFHLTPTGLKHLKKKTK